MLCPRVRSGVRGAVSGGPRSRQGPGQPGEVHRAAETGVRLQKAHDDRHGRLVVPVARDAVVGRLPYGAAHHLHDLLVSGAS